jgi:hypothetical protein
MTWTVVPTIGFRTTTKLLVFTVWNYDVLTTSGTIIAQLVQNFMKTQCCKVTIPWTDRTLTLYEAQKVRELLHVHITTANKAGSQ